MISLRTGSAVGIEVGHNRLVCTLLKKGWRDFSLRQSHIIDNYTDLPPTELQAQLQDFLKVNGADAEDVVLGLPSEWAIVRYLELPLEVEEKLEQVVRFQVERFEPTEERNSYSDYVVLERDEISKKLRLQLVMVPREVVDECLERFRAAQLQPRSLGLSSLAMHHLFSLHAQGYPDQHPILVLGLSETNLDILAILGPDACLSGRRSLRKDHFNLEEICRELDLFTSQLRLPGEGFSQIYLTGDLAHAILPEFRERFAGTEMLTERLQLKETSVSKKELGGLAGSIGLAASAIAGKGPNSFNLIPPEKRAVREKPSRIPTLILMALLATVSLALVSRQYLQNHSLLDQLESHVQELKPEVDYALGLRNQVEVKKAELQELETLMQGQQRMLVVLKELTEKIGDDTFLQNVNIQGEKLTLTGFSDSAATLLPILRESPYLTSVESRFITRDPTTKKEKFTFEAAIE